MESKKSTYKDSGVDLNLGDSFVHGLKSRLKSTFNGNVLRGIGLFGSMYSLKDYRDRDYAIVSSVDGVGTKLKIAFMCQKHDTVGIDLVNHCVNDILVQGAAPLFFMDYISFTALTDDVLEGIMEGFIKGCNKNDISLIGGETAQMPGFYRQGEYDLVGFITGIVSQNKIIDGSEIKNGDLLIGLPSNGLHTNGYSLARHVLFEKASFTIDQYFEELGMTLGEYLLIPHRSYLSDIRSISGFVDIKGMAHITGGGIPGNISRVIPRHLSCIIKLSSYKIPYIFELIKESGNIDEEEMRNCFNMGIGMIIIIGQDQIEDFRRGYDRPFYELGHIDSMNSSRVTYI